MAEDQKKNKKGFVKQKKRKQGDLGKTILDESFEYNPDELATKETEIKPEKILYDGCECERSFYFFKKGWFI